MQNLSLNWKIFLPLALVIGCTFALSFELSAWLQRDLAIRLAGEKVESAANTYMDQLNVLMMTGPSPTARSCRPSSRARPASSRPA